MYFLLFISIVIVVYISAFKDNFTQEHIDKVTPFFILITVVSLALCVMSSMLGRG